MKSSRDNESVRPAASTKSIRALALANYPALARAVESFIRGNARFESSIIIDQTVDIVMQCEDFVSLFETPIKRQALTMDDALHWVVFLSFAPGIAVAEGDEPFSSKSKFNVAEAIKLIGEVYDLGVQQVVDEHFEADEDDDDEEDDEDES